MSDRDDKMQEKEFIETFDRFGDAIFRFLVLKVSNRALAEDLTQDTFMRYWQSLREGKEMVNTRSFIYTIANNLAKDWYKKKKSDSLDAHLEKGLDPIDQSEADPETSAAYAEVLGVVDDLEETDRVAILLRHVEGLPPREIAELLGESPNTVSVRLTRALERLRAKLNAPRT